MQKVPQGGVSEHLDHNGMNTEQASKRANVDAESVILRRRPKAGREASNASNVWCHRGIGDGMGAMEQRVNTGSPVRRGERPQLEIVKARKRVTIVERRDLSSRAGLEAARAGRLT